MRLLNLKGRTIATLGATQNKFTVRVPTGNEMPTMHWETITQVYHLSRLAEDL